MLKTHITGAADIAKTDLMSVQLGEAAHFASLLHDLGKATSKYQNYLLNASAGKDVIRGSVIHTFQGCRWILEKYHQTNDNAVRITAELLAFAVGAHHGLFDGVDEKKRSGFEHRIMAENTDYEEAADNFLKHCYSELELDSWFQAAHEQLLKVYRIIGTICQKPNAYEKATFYYGLLARLLLSAVIDGDRGDTASYSKPDEIRKKIDTTKEFWNQLLLNVEKKLKGPQKKSVLNETRMRISEQAIVFSEQEGGILRLNIPTGAGKTLTSLRFALKYAKTHDKKRILFVAPLLSIIEQNARTIRDYVQDDSVILEHHTNIIREKYTEEELTVHELLAENWDAPIIITTLVQLLNTLFSGKKTAIRRFQALCGSVIVIDEVQSVPNKLLSLFNLATNFLVKVCKATIVLSSATQPCLEEAKYPLLKEIQDIIPYDSKTWQVFARTTILDAGSMKMEELPGFCVQIASEWKHLLVVCNTRREAAYLFSALEERGLTCFHLSAGMCTQHRRDVLQNVYDYPKEKQLVCISTQVIEAGVDISFSAVIRLCAGLENVIQAAGRCNRNKESETRAPVYIVRCIDEKLGPLIDIQKAKTAMLELLELYRNDPEAQGNDLASNEAVRSYYKCLYQNLPSDYQDYPLPDLQSSLLDLLSMNKTFCESEEYMLNQAFKLAGTLFQVFDEDTESVIVPYGKGKELIQELKQRGYPTKEWLDMATPYSISLYRNQMDSLPTYAVTEYHEISVLDGGYYNSKVGFAPHGNGAGNYLGV